MSDSTVYVWQTQPQCGTCEPEAISDASFHLLTALDLPIPQERVLIKPNVTIATPRESGIDTDCAHVEGIVRWLLSTGRSRHSVAIGEGGGTWMPEGFCVAGFADLACAYGVELVSFNDRRLRYVERDSDFIADRIRVTGRRQRLAARAVDGDTFLINAPKLKTHNAMAISICLKNLMGTQHRDDRSLCSISRQYADATGMDYERRFAHEMCNLYASVKPDFHVVDGAIARMGSGFQDGQNYPLGLTVAGADGFAVDFACAYFMGFNPQHLLLFQVAAEKGLAPAHIDDLDIRRVTGDGVCPLSTKAVDQLSSPGGFWVKYHREGGGNGKPQRLEEFCPSAYRLPVMDRRAAPPATSW